MRLGGAEGGGSGLSNNSSSGFGGKGGYAIGTLTVVSGNTLNIYVGGYGQSSTLGTALGGYNGGGSGYASSSVEPGNGGGGASDVRLNGQAFTDRVIVAGGGGGGGEDAGDSFGNGGGLNGVGYSTTYDASQTAAGAGGGLGFGGTTGSGDGGGGGGGYYGGGTYSSTTVGDDTQGGGGGSGYIGGMTSGSLIDGLTSMPNPLGGTMIGRSGNGFVRITYALNGAGVTVSSNTNIICSGQSVSLTAASVVSYTWLPAGSFAGSNSASIIDAPTSNVVYSVQGTNSIGCISTTIFPVNVDPALPTLTVANTANSGGICPTKTVALTASGALTYTWSPSATNGVAFAPTATNEYTVTGGNSCGTSTAVTSVSIRPLPNITPVASTSSLCSGLTLTLTGVGNSTAYVWSGGSYSYYQRCWFFTGSFCKL